MMIIQTLHVCFVCSLAFVAINAKSLSLFVDGDKNWPRILHPGGKASQLISAADAAENSDIQRPKPSMVISNCDGSQAKTDMKGRLFD